MKKCTNPNHPTEFLEGSMIPWWYSEKNQPCECNEPYEISHKAITYSDYLLWRCVCTKCTNNWCRFLEG